MHQRPSCFGLHAHRPALIRSQKEGSSVHTMQALQGKTEKCGIICSHKGMYYSALVLFYPRNDLFAAYCWYHLLTYIHQCQCGATDPKTLKDILASVNAAHAAANESGSASATANTSAEPEIETRKGQPGSKPTFPRGLKDVHEIAAAANALQGWGEDDQVVKAAERTGKLIPRHKKMT